MSDGTSLIFDWEAWKRAFRPGLRVLGYTSAFFVIISLLTLLPLYLLGETGEVYNFMGSINSIITFGFIFVAIFKVIEEERVRVSMELGKGSIKLA